MKSLERIPLHDHSDRNSGGAIDGGSVVQLVGGGSTTTTSGPALIEDHPTAETDTSLILAPDGSGGVAWVGAASSGFLTTTEGEGHAIDTNTASGAAATIDCSLANIFDITLTANCTLSITNPPAAGVGGIITVILRQGGTGSYTVTWPGTVDWQDTDGTTGGSAPTLWTAVGAQDVIELATLDGGVTWGGSLSRAGGTPATTVESETTFGITPAVGTDTEYARQDHTHGTPADPVTDTAILALVPAHAHVASETHLSDGSTVTWTLDQVYEPGSVIAWNTTTIARLTVTEVPPDQATISAAGTTGDLLVFDYAATIS